MSVRSAIIGIASTASLSACGESVSALNRWKLNSAAGPSNSFFSSIRQ